MSHDFRMLPIHRQKVGRTQNSYDAALNFYTRLRYMMILIGLAFFTEAMLMAYALTKVPFTSTTLKIYGLYNIPILLYMMLLIIQYKFLYDGIVKQNRILMSIALIPQLLLNAGYFFLTFMVLAVIQGNGTENFFKGLISLYLMISLFFHYAPHNLFYYAVIVFLGLVVLWTVCFVTTIILHIVDSIWAFADMFFLLPRNKKFGNITITNKHVFDDTRLEHIFIQSMIHLHRDDKMRADSRKQFFNVSNNRIRLAMIDGDIMGILVETKDRKSIRDILVLPDNHREGIGTALLKDFEERHAFELNSIKINVPDMYKDKGIPFLQKSGWRAESRNVFIKERIQ